MNYMVRNIKQTKHTVLILTTKLELLKLKLFLLRRLLATTLNGPSSLHQFQPSRRRDNAHTVIVVGKRLNITVVMWLCAMRGV